MATGTTEVSLNKEQKKAATYGDGPLLIIAGAGTGKTTVITQRIAWLINQKKINPEDVLALTFTDKAASEMEERVDELLPLGYFDLWISTFHSFCERILKQHALDIGLPHEFKILNQTDAWLLVRQNLDRFDLDYYKPLGNPTKFIHALIKHFSRAKDEEISPKDYLQFAEEVKLKKDNAEYAEDEAGRLEEIANAYHVYQQLLLENSVLDFGDLIVYTLKLFRERPSILKKYQEQFKYILVDEFQDTNWAQYELVKLLSQPRKNLTVVGDDDQSIYKFRGASVSNILEFKNDFPRADEIVLTENYRSKQNILDLSYKFIQTNNPNRLEAQLDQIDKSLKAFRKGKAEVVHLHTPTKEDEARSVIEKILELKKEKDLSWNDFAVLMRANSQADLFMQAFIQADIPYQFLASRGLFAKPLIMDIVAYLKLLDSYHESTAMWRVLSMEAVGLPADDLMQLTHFARRKSWSIYEGMKKSAMIGGLSDQGRLAIAKVLGWIDKHTLLARQERVSRVVLAFLEDTGLLATLGNVQATDKETLEQVNYMRQFFSVLEQFEQEANDPSVKQFMEAMSLMLDAGDEGSLNTMLDEGPESVKFLTVHAAKGLEFPYVFIVNLVDLRFPSVGRKDPIELPDELVKEKIPKGNIHLEEERRLFYVAMTRAKDGLYFTSAEDYGGARKKKLSRFLHEIGFEDTEVKDAIKRVKAKKKSKVTESLLPTALPSRFSFTQLKTFQTCPYQYRFAHILKIPVKGKHTFSFGRTMHTSLQRFFEQIANQTGNQASLFDQQKKDKPQVPTLEQLLEMYEAAWIDDWYQSAGHQKKYKAKGRELLTAFYKTYENNWPDVQYVEKPFHLKLGEYSIKGVMDRVDHVPTQDGQGLEIVDYKTGNAPKSDKILDKDQLLIYQLASEELFDAKPSLLTYHYLDGDKKYSFIGTSEELETMKEKIVSTIDKMKTSDFSATPSAFVCKNCDYKDICEFRIT